MYRITYILTTYNKLPYLRHVLGRLVAAREPDEEIVVCDGGSTDGTPDYLRELFEGGHIQQMVSERDRGEAHGFNKGMLMARGRYLKIITDDDAFHYPAIRQAVDFMDANPNIDVMSGNAWQVTLEDLSRAEFFQYCIDHFERWRQTGESVNLLGLPLIVRRSSLALTGLFFTGMVQVDGEFTFRITSLNVNLAFYTAVLSMRIENPQSNLRAMGKATFSETDRMRYYYDKRIAHDLYHYIRYKSVASDALKAILRPVKHLYLRLTAKTSGPTAPVVSTGYNFEPGEDNIQAAFRICDAFMADHNEMHPAIFLTREHSSEMVKVNPGK